MSEDRLQTIEEKLDRYHAEMMQRFHGERGDNGVYGRLQHVESTLGFLQWGARCLWAGLLAALSGVWAALMK